MKKRIGIIALCYIILMIIVMHIIVFFRTDLYENTDKVKVVVTLYPEYDFVSKIGGDKVKIKRLIDAGVEAHTYEPSVKDMKEISDSDMFIYTCDSMEPWVKTILNSVNTSNIKIVDSSKNIELIELDKFMEENSDIIEEHYHSQESHEEYEYDGHIWMNPQNAIIMVNTICDSLIDINPENEEYYRNNALQYIKELQILDEEIESNLKEYNINELVFGGEFSYAYFCDRYDLKVVSAYTACGEGAEPSVARIKEIIDYINSKKITKVFYEELSEGTVANMISEETIAVPLVFNTLHNVSKQEIGNGADYCNIMRKNLNEIIR